jgi:hypothetical protein
MLTIEQVTADLMDIDWKSVFEIAMFVAYSAAAVFWVISATRRLTVIRRGLEDLDKVTTLSNDLKTMSTWNAWAAGATAVGVALQILARFTPSQ